MRMIFNYGNGVECWLMDGEFYVYSEGEKLERVCPSEGMAREVAAGL